MISWMLLIAASLSSHSVESSMRVAPGASLAPLLQEHASEELRWGLNGAPPTKHGAELIAPNQVGEHWLVAYSEAGQPALWLRFSVESDDASQAQAQAQAQAARPLQLMVDAEPPQAQLTVEGAQLQLADRRVVAAEARLLAEAHDLSGGETATLWVNGAAVDMTRHWSDGVPEGPVQVWLQVEDALGNRGQRARTDLWLDREAPTLRWQRLDPREGAPEDVFDGRRARLRLQVEDAGAGVASLRVGGRALDPQQASGAGIEIKVRGSGLDYEAEDRVGHRLQGRLPLRVDREGPKLLASLAGSALALDALQVTRGDSLQLQAVDEVAGVASACVEASVWYRECRPLPMELTGLSRGRYRMKFRAVDSVGNRSAQRFQIEVLR